VDGKKRSYNDLPCGQKEAEAKAVLQDH